MGKKATGKTFKDRVSGETVYELAKQGATYVEIGNAFNVKGSTVCFNYREEFNRGKADMQMAIRRTQLKVALEDEDPGMLKHLGKHECGQNDQITVINAEAELDDMSTDQLFDFLNTYDEDTVKH